jgi:hypothetical protein
LLDLIKEIVRQQGNIILSLPKPRQNKRHHIEPIVEVIMEATVKHSLFQTDIGGLVLTSAILLK